MHVILAFALLGEISKTWSNLGIEVIDFALVFNIFAINKAFYHKANYVENYALQILIKSLSVSY